MAIGSIITVVLAMTGEASRKLCNMIDTAWSLLEKELRQRGSNEGNNDHFRGQVRSMSWSRWVVAES